MTMTTKLTVSLALFASIASPAIAATASTPDFGHNVLIFNPSMPPAIIQAQIDKVYVTQRRNEFGPERNAIVFLPGDYNVDVPTSFYTQVLGLGASPDSVHITGNVHSDAAARNDNATITLGQKTRELPRCLNRRSAATDTVLPEKFDDHSPPSETPGPWRSPCRRKN